MSSIFFCHSSNDSGIAKEVKAHLEQWGHRSIFLDFDPENGIPAGRDWEKELYGKLRECRAVIVLCSHVSMASRWCFAEITHAKALGKPVFPIKIDNVQVDSILTSVQVIDATAGWGQAYQRLKKGLLAAGLDPQDYFDWDGTRPPYPGLPAFQEEDAAIFFGREKEIREGQALLNRLQQFGGPRLTLILGASGSGKSSLMRAGLLPRLKRDQRWVVIDPFRPLKAPFDELATVLSQWFAQLPQAEKPAQADVASIRDRIRWEERDPKKSVDAFVLLTKELREKAGSREATVLLMIDQCEELLAGSANEESNQFLIFLRAVLDRDDSHLMVLATLRSDFLGSFQDHRVMRGLRVETFPVPQMQVDDLASVIEGPAKTAGLELGPGLVQAMIGDTKTSDALPLLAFTLRELYEGYGKDKQLMLEEYRDKLGRLDGCIRKAAEAVLSAKVLSGKEVSDLGTAFLSMVRVADNEQYAKQPVEWKNLPASIHDVLERLVIARLLISGGDTNGRTIEVAHEALFRAWPRLVGWLVDNKAFLVWQQRLNTMIKEWNKNRQSPDLLVRGLPLREALDWLKKKPDSFSSPQQQFVMASKSHVMRRRWLAAAVAFVLILYLALVGWAQAKFNGLETRLATKVLVTQLGFDLLSPEMVVIKAGSFHRGDLEKKDESAQPIHEVRLQKDFTLGKYEVTFDDYEPFLKVTGHKGGVISDEGWGRGRHPVINVRWEDAQEYIKWLNELTGQHYRLPTEPEWEYAARSGGKNEMWAEISESQWKNFAVYDSWRTEPVGSKQPNGLGLYDLSGNVWEWVEDCWHETYEGAPVDGSAWVETHGGTCGNRVLRGGSWSNGPVRVSFRGRHFADSRNFNIGFRLAQDLEP